MTAFIKQLLTLSAVCLLCLPASGQQTGNRADQDLMKAGILHTGYKFAEAEKLYRKALDNTSDSLAALSIMDKIVQCQNGLNMMQYVSHISGIASDMFSIKDFYLYLDDLKDKSWITVPNPFVRTEQGGQHQYYTAMYFPPDRDSVIFSAPDEYGRWSIYISVKKDSTLWSVPELLSANIFSGKNDIFPILSQDGRTLYFASDGMPGMGGYDLFYSKWDETAEDWSTPENLGFPFSSTGDDILFLNSNDGKYSITVSNRETAGDSVRIYVSKYTATAVKSPLRPDESPEVLASFPPDRPDDNAGTVSGHEDDAGTDYKEHSAGTESYSRLIHNLRRLQDEQKSRIDKIEESRRIYETASGNDREFLAGIIRDLEQESLDIKKKIDDVSATVRQMELQFLTEGIIPEVYDENEYRTVEPKPQAKKEKEYVFRKHSPGKIPFLTVETPEPEFDYTFRILGRDKGQFVEDRTLPEGIVYQIQFAVLSTHASIRDIRGMSPVFVTRLASGKYLHTVGLFRTFKEAAASLDKVKKNGFPDAFVIAFKNGRSIDMKTAKAQEGKIRKTVSGQAAPMRARQQDQNENMLFQVVLRGYSDSLPANVLSLIQKSCKKDISQSSDDEGKLFAVGPFKSREEADELLSVLAGAGITDISIENIKL